MNNQKTEKIINELDRNQDRILSNLNQKDIDTYCWIKKKFDKNKNVAKDLTFQKTFKAFYIMNSAGLSDKQKERFFGLLSNKERNLEHILSELYKIPRRDSKNSIQFSFATKLVHTIDNTKPIYDINVGRIINKAISGRSEKEKINSCIEIFNYLNELYPSLIKENRVKKTISRFRKKFNANKNKIPDVKALDFIIWSLGNIKNNKNNKKEHFQKMDMNKIFNKLEKKILSINKSIEKDDSVKSYNKYQVNGYGFVNVSIYKRKLKIEVKKQELKKDREGRFQKYPNGLYPLWKWVDIRQDEEIDYALEVIKEAYEYTVKSTRGKKLKEAKEIIATTAEESIEDKIRRIIRGGESHKVEFKSSCLNRFEIAKNMSAFMNAKGGVLLIGVNDNKHITGLNRDFGYLRNRPYGADDRDRFLLKIDYIIREFLGVEFIDYIKVKILEMDGKDICIIKLDKSKSPSFIRGNRRPLLYIRLNAATILTSKTEETKYIREHFNKRTHFNMRKLLKIKNLLKTFTKTSTKNNEEEVIKNILELFYNIKKTFPLFRTSAGDHVLCSGIISVYFKLNKVDQAIERALEISDDYIENRLDINTTCYLVITNLLSNKYYSLTISFEEGLEMRNELKRRIKRIEKEFLKKDKIRTK